MRWRAGVERMTGCKVTDLAPGELRAGKKAKEEKVERETGWGGGERERERKK
jgi:hypothetical protein